MISRDLDKFYTAAHVVDYILNIIKLTDYDMCIEPSAGSGAFSLPLSNILPTMAYDIHPEHSTIICADFLTLNIQPQINHAKSVVAIGNPPFGKQASLACKFFNKCASYSNVNMLCMIFPKSFKKVSIQNRLNLEFSCIHQEDLPVNSYLLNGKEYDVPTVFQMWKRYPIHQKREKVYCENLIESVVFTKQPKNGDVSIRRVGGKAGYTSMYDNQSAQSHYFIRFLTDKNDKLQFISQLNSIKWKYNDTVGPRSISKYQLVPIINRIIILN